MKNLFSLLLFTFLSFAVYAQGYKIGDKARDFDLKNIDGKMVSMNSMKDAKGFIVIFTCNHCPFSQVYENRIIELDKSYSPKGYKVIAINPNDAKIVPDDSYENMVINAKEKGFKFPYLHDESQEVAAAYGATRTPHVYILERDNKDYFVRYIGAIDNNSEDSDKADKKYVAEAVNALLGGKKVETPETKAIGCTIKWKK
jgi:peroxiredoxin